MDLQYTHDGVTYRNLRDLVMAVTKGDFSRLVPPIKAVRESSGLSLVDSKMVVLGVRASVEAEAQAQTCPTLAEPSGFDSFRLSRIASAWAFYEDDYSDGAEKTFVEKVEKILAEAFIFTTLTIATRK